MLLAVYLLNTGLTAVVVYWGHLLGINIETEMRRRAFDHLQKLSFSFYDNSKTGNLITHVTKDLEDVGEVAHHGPEDLFIAVMTFIGAFALMFTVNWRLALLTTIITPVVTVLSSRYGARMTQQLPRAVPPGGRVQRAHRGERRRHARGAGLRQRGARAALFAVDNAQYRRTKLQAYRLMAASSSITYLGMRLTQMVVMVAGTWFVLHGQLSEGGFISLPAAGRRVPAPGGEDQRRAGDLSQGDRRLPPLHRAARHRAGHRRPARRRAVPARCAATSGSRA